MMILNLNKGDKVHLQNTVTINGNSYKSIKIDTPKSRQYKGLNNIQTDLNRIKGSIQRYLENPSNEFEYFRSLIITYRKCFADNNGRHAKLEIQRDLKGTSQHQLGIHEMLIELGNKYIAHADKTLYDQSSVALVLDNHKKAIGIAVFQMNLENFELNNYKIWLELIDLLKENLTITLKKLYNSIINEYNTSL
jgi:hypothetical protein